MEATSKCPWDVTDIFIGCITSRSELYKSIIFQSFSCSLGESFHPERQRLPCQLERENGNQQKSNFKREVKDWKRIRTLEVNYNKKEYKISTT
jgi:hypothetical protein